jgi:hypothetical protein
MFFCANMHFQPPPLQLKIGEWKNERVEWQGKWGEWQREILPSQPRDDTFRRQDAPFIGGAGAAAADVTSLVCHPKE